MDPSVDQCDHKGSVKYKREAQEENPGDGRVRTWPDIAGFQDGERVPEPRNAGGFQKLTHSF